MEKFEKVTELINELYPNDNNNNRNLLLTVLENDQIKHRNRENSSQWNGLAALINKKQLFKHYADKIIADSVKIKKLEKLVESKNEGNKLKNLYKETFKMLFNLPKEKYKQVVECIPKNYTDNAETLEMILNFLAKKKKTDGADNSAYLNTLENLQNQTKALKQSEENGEIKKVEEDIADDNVVLPSNPCQENKPDIEKDDDVAIIKNADEELDDAHSDYESDSDNEIVATPAIVETKIEDTNKHDRIIPLIAEIYADNDENHAIILFYLGNEEDKHGSREKSSCWNILADLIQNERSFRLYADSLIQQCRENDTSKILRDGVKFLDEMRCNDLGQTEFLKAVNEKNQSSLLKFLPQFAGIWCRIPLESKLAILNFLRSSIQQIGFLSNSMLTETVDGIIAGIGGLAKYGGTITTILVLFPMGYEILRSIYLWYTNQISGKRAIQNVLKTATDTTISFAGAVGGATIGGMIAGPIGAIACGIIGIIIAAKITKLFTKYLCKKIFNLPPTQALEDAYKYLGIHHETSDDEISDAYRRRILIDDPQKPSGSREALCELQANYTIICISRAEANKKVCLRNRRKR